MSSEALTGQQVDDAGLDGWAFLLHYGIHGLQTRIHTKASADGLLSISSIGQAAQELDRHADLDLRRSRVDVRLAGDGSGVTEQDMNLAWRITDIAAAADAELECASLAHVELTLDTRTGDGSEHSGRRCSTVNWLPTAIGPTWATRTRCCPSSGSNPPAAKNPGSAGTPTSGSTRANYKPGIDAAIAAGGQLVRGDDLNRGCTLSDPQGNKVCL